MRFRQLAAVLVLLSPLAFARRLPPSTRPMRAQTDGSSRSTGRC